MSNIKIMSEILSNKIAAGEVVEKCLSIVKELVENSIDALSDEIKIELKESGLREIRVIDNGIGMDEQDTLLAFERHATSKLYSDDDLFSINTLGFRGEALPSIASISEIVLKTSKENKGTKVHIKGGKIIENSPSELRKGTSITVSNLFYNTPARLKHLSSPYSELSSIVSYIHKIALSYPHVKFKLINDEKELFNTSGDGNLLKVINVIYGVDVTKKMIKASDFNNDYNIDGYISMPEVTRKTRDHMITLVNGRVIRNQELNRTINDSYHTYKEDSRYPIVVLNIQTDPNLIDVNIHPSKLDIKFSNFDDLKNIINRMIKNGIKNKLLIPKIETKVEKSEKTYELPTINLDTIFNNNIEDIKEEYTIEQYITKEEETLIENDNFIEKVDQKNKLECLYPIGLALGTYIICQNEKGIYLIDQHAAKERINYEKYRYMLSHPSKDSISLLVPIIIQLPLNEYIIIKENIDIIRNLNIEISEFGINSFRITSHPLWFTKNYEQEIMNKIIELILSIERNFNLEKFNDRLSMNISCKMSIKANTNISALEMESLINDLRNCENPFTCPHGRPTIISYSIYELEKLFKRSM